MHKRKMIVRDLSWLSFNARVLQEAADDSVPLKERIKFLGIFSNNLDEFFRVRVATLNRMLQVGTKRMHLEHNPADILREIQLRVMQLQEEFERTWNSIRLQMRNQNIFLTDEKKLNISQQKFILQYFNEEVRSYIVPLMLESMHNFPVLNDKSIYLACTLSMKDQSIPQKFALVSIPVRRLPRFIILPSKSPDETYIILLEDIIRFCLPNIFSFFGYDCFTSHVIKVTRDAEIDIDNDLSTSLIQKIEKGLKNRKRGKPVRFVFDKDIPPHLLSYLVKRLNLTHRDNLIPGGRIHNFKDFMNFPEQVFSQKSHRKMPFTHPALRNTHSVTKVILTQDVMLNFPYHSYNSVIDLLREAAIDPEVTSIRITCYRLAPRSKVINALTNAVRNGKHVTVVLELRARFDEEANLEWKNELEDAGVKVLIGVHNLKVHAKLCLIKKRTADATLMYGFISTGNQNEKTAMAYGDHCLLTANKAIMADVNRVFTYLESPVTREDYLRGCKILSCSPFSMRKDLVNLIEKEIRNAASGKKAGITIKLNSLSDEILINKLYDAARAGVEVRMVIRGICGMYTENKKFKAPVTAISIIDEYLEHARLFIFYNEGNEKVFISSADWMVRNLDHRVEVTCPILDPAIKEELKEIIEIQLKDNIKARILDNEQNNYYVNPRNQKKVRSQLEIYNFLYKKRGSAVVPDFYLP